MMNTKLYLSLRPWIVGIFYCAFVFLATFSPASAQELVTDFSADITSGKAPLTVNFTDASTGAITGWSWDFGDGSPADANQNPNHVFTIPGTYTVTLTVTREGGILDMCTKQNYITVSESTGFRADVTTGKAPLTVNFTDESTGGITGWSWDFGDGSPADANQNPNHVFTIPGTYTVTLTVTREGGILDTCTKQNYITVTETSGFSADVTAGKAPLTVNFTDESTGAITGWSWDFGDGSPIDTSQNPSHVYGAPGLYTVALTITSEIGTVDTCTKQGYIRVHDGKNLLIMGWDGAGLINVNRLLNEQKLPNLKRLIDEHGGHIVPLELIAKTNTISSWTQAFTGLTYDQTGVLGNHYLFPHIKRLRQLAWYNQDQELFSNMGFWVRELPYEFSIVKDVQDKGHKVGWMVSKLAYLGQNPQTTPLSQIALHADFFSAHRPYIPEEGGIVPDDQNYVKLLTDETIQFIQNNDGYFVFEHLTPDLYGHKYGENGARYEEEFIHCDEALGNLLDVVDPATTRVIVIADHGFDEGGNNHFNAPDAWIATNLPVHFLYWQQQDQRAFGTMRDVAPTILDWYDIDFKSRRPQIRGKSLLQK